MTIRACRRAAVVAIALALGSACGGGGDTGKAVPRSLVKAESAAEGTIDLILAGQRDRAVRLAAELDTLAHGALADDIDGIATKEQLGELQGRATELARVAGTGQITEAALAANHAFEIIAQLYRHFETDVPAAVRLLDHHDLEARLRATAGQIDGVRKAVDQLAATWAELAGSFPPGEKASATRARYEAHVAALGSLAGAGTDFDGMAREADVGLGLIGELEAVYAS